MKATLNIKVLKQVKGKKRRQKINDFAEALNDVKLYEEGKKKLKSAGKLLNKL